jgi:hypothetical protein
VLKTIVACDVSCKSDTAQGPLQPASCVAKVTIYDTMQHPIFSLYSFQEMYQGVGFRAEMESEDADDLQRARGPSSK